MPENEPDRLVTVPALGPLIVQVAVASLSVPVPVSWRLAIPENEPERLVTVPAFEPVMVHVALASISVPLPVSVMLSNDVQLTAPLLPAFAPVIVLVCLAPLIVSLFELPTAVLRPLQMPPMP